MMNDSAILQPVNSSITSPLKERVAIHPLNSQRERHRWLREEPLSRCAQEPPISPPNPRIDIGLEIAGSRRVAAESGHESVRSSRDSRDQVDGYPDDDTEVLKVGILPVCQVKRRVSSNDVVPQQFLGPNYRDVRVTQCGRLYG